MEWVSHTVDPCMEAFTEVIIGHEINGWVTSAYVRYDNDGKHWFDSHVNGYDDPTHWMPMPGIGKVAQ